MLFGNGAEKAYGKAQQKPKNGKGGGDLPQEIVGETFIAPDVPTEPKIENTSRNEFHSGNNSGANQCAKQ